ncbi:helix-turn-helix transcriptional regulator [Pseudoalteromonas sp. CH_XMU1449-3]|uniref:helix-turn-helix transcriptional regulator n=1 Tax=Pseudoalteromonas sp. CH_XMU1449-3 TaxID=3107774 RepID=UPI0030082CE9
MNKLEYDLLEKYLEQLSFRTNNAIRELQQVQRHLESFQSHISKQSFVSQSMPKFDSLHLSTHSAQIKNKSPNDLIRIKEVIQMTGLSRSTIYKLQNIKEFPESIKLSSRSVAWLRAAVEAWIQDKIA